MMLLNVPKTTTSTEIVGKKIYTKTSPKLLEKKCIYIYIYIHTKASPKILGKKKNHPKIVGEIIHHF